MQLGASLFLPALLKLGSVLSTLSAREATEFLIEKARSRGHGGGDNLSIVIVKLEPLAGQERQRQAFEQQAAAANAGHPVEGDEAQEAASSSAWMASSSSPK